MKRNSNALISTWFTPQDAWILGRLRIGKAHPLDLEEASTTFQPLARSIYSVPLSGREKVIDSWLDGAPDADAIKRAVLAVDPTQPMPVSADGPPRVATIRLICLADVVPRKVDWLWSGRIPMGMITMFAGDPKLGKSYVTLALAAAISRGAPLPFGDVPAGPASTIIFSAEDDPSRTIVPRLKAAGADLAKVHFVHSVVLGNGIETMPTLDTNLQAIETTAAGLGDCRLIVIDPITAYLGDVDDHRNADLRALLAPLKDMAERLDVAIVLINHLSKNSSGNGKHRVMGSVAYVGVCRANMLFVPDPTDSSGRRILLCDNGGNLAPPAPTLAFTINESPDGPVVEFLPEPVPITTQQALADEVQQSVDRQQAPERREAELWLREVLASGPLPAREVEEAAKSCGLSLMTLKRAKASVGVISTRQGFAKDARWIWSLPDPATPDRP